MEDTIIANILKTVQELYDKNDFVGAMEILEKHKSSVSAGVWHYNVGTIHGKLENWPMARFHLLMSELSGYTSPELSKNIEIIEQKLQVNRYEKPISIQDNLIKIGLFAGEGILTIISMILILVGVSIFKKSKNIRSLLLISLASATLVIINIWIGSWQRYMVIEKKPIYDGPSVIFETNNELQHGVMLITQKKENWLKVIYPSRFAGWIKEEGLKELR